MWEVDFSEELLVDCPPRKLSLKSSLSRDCPSLRGVTCYVPDFSSALGSSCKSLRSLLPLTPLLLLLFCLDFFLFLVLLSSRLSASQSANVLAACFLGVRPFRGLVELSEKIGVCSSELFLSADYELYSVNPS